MTKSPATSRLTYAAPALERGFDILELLATVSGGLTISEIGQHLGRSISEVFRVIIVMERRGWLHKDPASDRYRSTYWMLDVAFRGTPAQSLATVAAPIMQELATIANQSCHLVVRADTRGLIIQCNQNPGPSGFAMRTGAIIDLVSSCSGHVLLAFDTGAGRDALLEKLDPTEAAALHALDTRLAIIRERGYEMTPSSRTAGVTDLSVPIFGFGNTVVAALTVPYLVLIDSTHTIDLNAMREALCAAGHRISALLGADPLSHR